MSTNFGLTGVSNDLQLGLTGGKIKYEDNKFKLYANDGVTLSPLKAGNPVDSDDLVTKNALEQRTPKITVGTSEPTTPAIGDIWIDTN